VADGRTSGEGSQTLERGLLVLATLATHAEGLTVAQAAEESGLHRSIVHRLLTSLARTGFAERDASSRYRVGPALISLAGQMRPRLRATAEPVLQKLASDLDATASLVEVIGDAAVATVVAEPPTNGPRFSYRLGNRDPLDRGAGGLAALASADPAPGDPWRVREVRDAGYAATYGELNPGAYGAAAPIRGLSDTRASVNVVTNREDVMGAAVPRIMAAAQEISEAMR
jgi:DNA-binding IclR family transcriptional regulator